MSTDTKDIDTDNHQVEKRVLIAAIAAQGLALFALASLFALLPTMVRDLQLDGTATLWTVNAYTLMTASLALVGGVLGDQFGRKRTLIWGVILFALGSAGVALAPGANLLIGSRAVQGIGAAIILTGTVSIIRAAFPPERLGWAIGIYFMASAAVVLASPVIGGWLAGAGFWRVTYWIAVAAAVLAWFLLTRIPESRDERAVGKGIDWIGAALSATALIGVSNGFIQAGEAGFGDGTVILSLGIGLVALVAFVIVELRVERPLLDMRLFQKRRFNLFALYALIHTFTISAIGLFLIQNLQSAQGFSPSAAAMATIPLTLMMVLLSGWAGSTSDKLGPRPLLAGGALLGAIGSIWLAFSGVNATPSAYWTKFFPGLVMLGAGMGLIQTPLTRAIVVSGSAKAAGMMSGLNQLLIQSGTVIGVAVFGLIATQVFTAQHAHLLSQFPLNPADQVVVQLPDATQSFREAIAVTYKVVHLVVAALLFVNFLSALFLMKRRTREPALVSAEMDG